MAAVKKVFSFTNKRDIWRLIPSEYGYLVIEERDAKTREVFFNCLKITDGKILIKNFQLEEKYWVGIEAVHGDLIFFHKFRKPDMPNHKGIYALDIPTQKTIWKNDDLVFQLAKDDAVFAFQTGFEGRNYLSLNSKTGEVIKNMGGDFNEINKLREELMQNDFMKAFSFPSQFKDEENDLVISQLFKSLKEDKSIVGNIDWLKLNNYILFNYHMTNSDRTFNNYFRIFDSAKQKYVLKETVNSNTTNLIPESFFLINNLLFLLIEKTKLVVYRIKQ
jgi:hypothetical protein